MSWFHDNHIQKALVVCCKAGCFLAQALVLLAHVSFALGIWVQLLATVLPAMVCLLLSFWCNFW